MKPLHIWEYYFVCYNFASLNLVFSPGILTTMKVLTHHFPVTVTHAHDLQDHECATSLISCTLSGDPNSSFSSNGSSNTFYCVGTAYVFPEEPEPKTGRLILFQLLEGRKKRQLTIE